MNSHSPIIQLKPESLSTLEKTEPIINLNENFKIINLYLKQVKILQESSVNPKSDVVNEMVHNVYDPYIDFWGPYIGNKRSFIKWVQSKLFSKNHPVYKNADALLSLDIEKIFTNTVKKFESFSGKYPKGTWYLIYGPGWTNMGGLKNGIMLLDFSRMNPTNEEISFLLPHELNHQVYHDEYIDEDDNTVLYSIINEGFASYFNYIFWDKKFSQAKAVAYSEDEWNWCLLHEKEIFDKAQKYLNSSNKNDIELFNFRKKKFLNWGPGAIGYFIGFRICQSYIKTNGKNSWKDIYQMSVSEVYRKSGYQKSLKEKHKDPANTEKKS